MDRKLAKVFYFSSYKFEPEKKRVVFEYKTEFEDAEPMIFVETLILPKIPEKMGNLQKILESLHLILGISYWKFYCAPIVRHNYNLSKKEADFWNTVYKKGLGEFFYRNNLDPKISPKFSFVSSLRGRNVATDEAIPANKIASSPAAPRNDGEKCLVGVGGGKDSVVVIELLKEAKFDATAFFVQTNKESGLVEKIIETMNIGSLKVQRILDSKVFETHNYNGHIPISAIYAFLGVFLAILYNYKYVIVGNEYSSNFGNIKYKGLDINHQWSKSFEFEKMFQEYVAEFITSDVFYFSLLRPFYEIRIVKMFAKYKKYFSHFSSCNKNFKINQKEGGGLWCGKCAKCVFVFTLLSAFLSKKDDIKIFGKNLYLDESLLPLFKNIFGFGKMKPFDCVGTFEEAQAALFLAKNKFKNDFIVKNLAGKIKNGKVLAKNVLQTQIESSVPEQFKFLGMEKVLIMRFGQEGQSIKKYLKKYYPKIKITSALKPQGEDYLDKQENFDIAVKTPGINKNLIKIPYTTSTNIFFSKISKINKIVGVTGSKGKSTTSSLIYEILKEAGKPVRFFGNIGKPMLEALMETVKNEEIFVLELSSFQLDDIKFSPDIAVVTNLFPEHMDFHGGLKNYYNAKKNIIKFQRENDYFVYDPKNKLMKSWLAGYKGKPVSFAENVPLEDREIPLLGGHNKKNIRAAVAVAKFFNISDEIIARAIKNFKPLPHRLEFIGEFKGIKFYDDAISTTPESTILAIEALKNIGTIFLGGQDRGYNFLQLEKIIKKYKIKNIVLFPDSGKKILKSRNGLNVINAKNMQEAVKFAYRFTEKGKICLLSCASPSYSLWKNFEEKGDQFKKLVRKFSK